MRTTLFAALLLAAPLSAQQLPTGFKAQQIADFERERRMTLAMVDSMPERLLHFKPVKEVRDFAQQIAHAAVPVAIFAASAKGEKPPTLGDSTVYLNSKPALRETVNKSYDYALGVVSGLSDADYAGHYDLREVDHDAVADPGARTRAQCLDPG